MSAFSDVRCTRCGGARLLKDGKPAQCSFLGCPSPLYDLRAERGAVDDDYRANGHILTDLCDMISFHKTGRINVVLRRAVEFIDGCSDTIVRLRTERDEARAAVPRTTSALSTEKK